tara:strand:- start:3361 stop:3654 length:294 start_codon:yes stop_codon:yes gene_type:complete
MIKPFKEFMAESITFTQIGELTPAQKVTVKKIPEFTTYLTLASDLGAKEVIITVDREGKYTKVTAEVQGLRIPGYFMVVLGPKGGILVSPKSQNARK